MRRTFAASILAIIVVAAPALAADTDARPAAHDVTAAVATTPSTPAPAPQGPAPDFSSSIEARFRRPAALPALYVASAGLQGYDAYSTLNALKNGGVEANPLMKNVVSHPAAFVALKATVAVTSIMAAERMWKNGNRLGAVGVMVASNVAMGLVAANNARVLSSLK